MGKLTGKLMGRVTRGGVLSGRSHTYTAVKSFFVLSVLIVAGHAGATAAGCSGQTPVQSGPQTVTVNGQARQFILSLPEPYAVKTPHALVFAFHGRTSPAAEVQRYYDLEHHAPETLGPTIFVYPVALTQADGTFGWWNSGDAPDELRDFKFFDILLTKLSKQLCIDTAEVYAVGHSLGGSFVNALGCHRAAVLRAIASLGGGPAAGTCRGKVAAMVLHNPHDRLVPFELGLGARDQFLAQDELTGPSTQDEPQSLNCERYGAPEVQNPVAWCPHTQDYSYGGRYYPHNWPDETGAAVMRFFAALP